VRGLAGKGVKICLFGINNLDTDAYEDLKNVEISTFGYKDDLYRKRAGSISKMKYLAVLRTIKNIVKSFKPDLIHAHFATSYGLIASLLNFHPLIISVWGSDVYHFPTISFLHKRLFKFNLSRGDKILSTSRVMAEEIGKYTSKEIIVTPFGVDTEVFQPIRVDRPFSEDDLVIGIIKTLETWYGDDLLIKAFAILKDKYPDKNLRLLIAGKGAETDRLKTLVNDLGLDPITLFTGHLPFRELPKYHNMIDISVFPSLKESFGVSVIEASACEKPVVVSGVGGHLEIVEHQKTGIIFEKGNIEELVNALEKLINNSELRNRYGKSGREKVKKEFNFNDNLLQMLQIYEATIPRSD
jgi:glycosyltransferase involved in cell wall biosynthesis